MKKEKKNIIYFIGPNFTVNSLAKPSLKVLSNSYNVICVSEGPLIRSDYFKHIVIPFKRNPDIFSDLRSLFKIMYIIYNYPNSQIVTSTPKMSLLVCIASKILFRKYKYIHRGAVYENFVGIKKTIYKKIDKLIINNSEETSFISESLFNVVTKDLGLKKLSYKRKFNSSKGVDTNIFRPDPSSRDSEKVTIGYLGRICQDKGYDDLISLIKDVRFSNCQILIKGRIEIKNSDEFIELLKLKNIDIINWDDKPHLFLKKIDILFFPSKREGFGNVAMEAASCGVPTVAYNITGVCDAVKDKVSGLLIEPNEDILDILYELIKNKNLLENLKQSSRNFAIENFNQKLVIEDMHKTLKL